MRLRRWVVAAVLVVGCLWLIGGILRAEPAARAWFAAVHGADVGVVNVEIGGAFPVIPPFWQVSISGDVVEAGHTTPVYRSYMQVWIEPISGFAIPGAAG